MIQTFEVSTGESEPARVGFPGIVPVIGEHSLPIRHLGPELGQNTSEVLTGLLGMDETQIAEATASKEHLPA